MAAHPNTAPAPFDAVDLEVVADTLDAFLKYDDAFRDLGATPVTTATRAIVADLERRARALAAHLVAADIPQDLQRALDDACEDLANRHGRAAQLQLHPGVYVLVGMLDDIEREWVTVRSIGQLVTTEKSTFHDRVAARAKLTALGAWPHG